MVAVVAGGPASARLVTAPGRLVALRELARGAVLVRVVARGEDGTLDPVEELGRDLGVCRWTTGDVTGADEDCDVVAADYGGVARWACTIGRRPAAKRRFAGRSD
jgi:hypothetical protein